MREAPPRGRSSPGARHSSQAAEGEFAVAATVDVAPPGAEFDLITRIRGKQFSLSPVQSMVAQISLTWGAYRHGSIPYRARTDSRDWRRFFLFVIEPRRKIYDYDPSDLR